ncbi:MAG TPA: biosynthetic-type acetolactate synthase large subunit [Selenomonadales bacterium]|nr:biosynthetic-type acetolactate synthase large subunit [Selenomonadales bacterium]
MQMSGAAAIVACLLEQGVDTVFGFPGGQVLPLYDALFDAPLTHILTVHEQGAAHAADGYARTSGRVGVCIATSGPGATNLVTGLANAYMDSVPLVAITGQVPTALLGKDSFQEVDTRGITMSVTKHNFLLREPGRLPETIRLAFHVARSGRPGPVLIDVPRDIQTATLDFQPSPPLPAQHRELPSQLKEEVCRAAAAIQAARRPVMVVGGGAVRGNACREARLVAETFQLPVVSTLMGLGAIPSSHPQFFGLTGMHGTKRANAVVHEADLIVAVGSRFSDRVTGDCSRYLTGKTLIHMDIDQAEVDKNVTAEIALIGELPVLLALLAGSKAGDTRQGRKTIRAKREDSPPHRECGRLTAPWIMRRLTQQVGEQAVIFATDVGQHQMWAAQYLSIEKPGTWLTSGGLGTMGFGLPAALGAQLAAPDHRVVLIAGDGGFKMTGLELYTAAAYKLPVIVIVLDNGALGMVRQWQHLFYGQRYSASLSARPFDFCGLARSCGVPARRVDSPQAFAEAFAAAWSERTPSVIVADIATADLVTPMVAPGAGLTEYVD